MIRRLLMAAAMAGVLVWSAHGPSSRAAAPNSQAEGEFVPLFDGKTLAGWNDGNGKPPAQGWEVVDGAIHRTARGGYLATDREFENFDLRFEWKIAKGTNS